MMNKKSLRFQTLRIVIVSLAILMGGAFIVSSIVLYRSFAKLEREIALENMQRVKQAFENIRETLEVKSQDWANWDDTYQFLIDRNQKYFVSNLNLSSMSTVQVNHVLLLDQQDNEAFRMSLDFDSMTENPTPEGFLKHFKSKSVLLQQKKEGDFTSGVLMVSQEPVVFVARPVLNSHGQGPAHGSLVFAQVFNQDRLAKLSKTVKMDLKLIPVEGKKLTGIQVKTIDWNIIAGYCTINDVFGNPSFALYAEIPRHIFKQAQLSSALLCGLLLLISLIFIFVIFFSIDQLFLQRLTLLSNEVARWNSSGKISLQGDDELTQVADKINEMLEKIKEAQKRISEDEKNLHDKDKELIAAQKTKVTELESLNKLFTQRTKELERMHLANLNILEDFREAKKQAEAASEAKSQFLANMSHEIRTPLNAILGFSDLLQRSRLDEKQRKYVDTINTSGKSLLLIVSDILEISKAEAKRIVLDQIDFDLLKTCQSAFEIISQKIFTKSIEMKMDLSDDLPVWVKGDPARLTQILMNVLSNAIKFTQQGTVHLIVMPEKTLDTNDKAGVRFEVHDTGIGIEKDKISNLFKIFTQVDGTTTRKFGGVGLGLAIAKNLTHLMGGNITVESQPGVGSKFIVTAVFLRGQPVVESNSEDMTITKDKDVFKVLVVEDSIPNQQLMKAYLRILGVTAGFMNNGQEAVEHLRVNKNYMLILMDMQMPVMDGCEATTIIRKEISTEIPIVALTAAAMQEDQDACLKAGMNDYLTKPLDINKLKDVIKRYVQNKWNDPHLQEQEAFKTELINSGQEIGLDPQEYKELLVGAIEVVDQDLKELINAITKEDHPAVKTIAHKFKGTLGNLRLKEMSRIALEIEELAKSKSSWNQMLAKEKEFEALLEKLRKVVA